MSEPESSDPAPTTSDPGEENVINLREVLEFEDEMMENAAAILGAGNDKVCSYSEGYIKRQALYSCLTCIPEAKTDPNKGGGICLACCYNCHDGHEMVELYTKRNFRCDCGNSKFGQVKCNLMPDKSETNELNKYNQNFGGLYCTCHRPYPDPDDSQPDEMIQCIVCEDWYHSRHLGSEVPSESYAEMICVDCVKKHEFLLHYDANKPISVTDEQNPAEEVEKKCKKPESKSETVSAKFWQDINWRCDLCKCEECMAMYKEQQIEYLLDVEDAVHLYEEKGKAKTKEFNEKHNREFYNSMDRVQLVEMVAGYNDLKENLSEFLQKFAVNKKVIREEDIKEFFDGMVARKKQKLSSGVPSTCR